MCIRNRKERKRWVTEFDEKNPDDLYPSALDSSRGRERVRISNPLARYTHVRRPGPTTNPSHHHYHPTMVLYTLAGV